MKKQLNNKHRTIVRLPENIWLTIRRMAFESGVSINAFLVSAIESKLLKGRKKEL